MAAAAEELWLQEILIIVALSDSGSGSRRSVAAGMIVVDLLARPPARENSGGG